ncbi:MAG: hypothetical protein HON77_06555 [Gammaproteobacteria bacterium]|jgi:hypothetical protein|nr:hypothetical protein [Gammaproteobacteria bacterium]MBT5685356.1 hypothetical protein [Gammaproteobacteria bacterium]MBT6583950.1 hypothetical protein [Gammaproteobacteria bacterium]MBT6890745.1 hypothetical protein [Gammaproteobacteria bacterium]
MAARLAFDGHKPVANLFPEEQALRTFEGNPMGREQKTNKETKKKALLSRKEKKAQKKAKKDSKAKIISDL